MGKDLYLVVWGAVAGLLSAIVLEYIKHQLDWRRAAAVDAEEARKKRSEQVTEFLRGENVLQLVDQPPDPAWLRQVSAARRHPLARLGLRSDEDFSTDAHVVSEGSGAPGKNVITLLKRFGKGRTRARRPSGQRGGKFLLGPAHILGRGSKCDIQVLDPAVSHLHAFIRFEGDRYVLYDLGSTGGTYVDELPVGMAGVHLLGGELIRIGDTVFEFGRVAKDEPSDPVDLFFMM
jgi:hypothetical protein